MSELELILLVAIIVVQLVNLGNLFYAQNQIDKMTREVDESLRRVKTTHAGDMIVTIGVDTSQAEATIKRLRHELLSLTPREM